MTGARRLCAVVPAAGRGTRVGSALPKILMPLAPGLTVWSLLRERLLPHVDRIVLVLSPSGAEVFAREVPPDPDLALRIAIQAEPRGMGDAVFSAESAWADADDLLVVWGDQVGLSAATIGQAARVQRDSPSASLTLPLVEVQRPYVQYDFDPAGTLAAVRQSREGDACDTHGLADVGCFGLSVAEGRLSAAWHGAMGPERLGRLTGELNFLPFLAELSSREGWVVNTLRVPDVDERLGINTPEELSFFRQRLRATR